jgi:hypothetical protein
MKLMPVTSVMASSNDNQVDDDEVNNNDEADPDELNLLQICCSWSDKISEGVLEYSISNEVDDDSKQIVRNAIQIGIY